MGPPPSPAPCARPRQPRRGPRVSETCAPAAEDRAWTFLSKGRAASGVAGLGFGFPSQPRPPPPPTTFDPIFAVYYLKLSSLFFMILPVIYGRSGNSFTGLSSAVTRGPRKERSEPARRLANAVVHWNGHAGVAAHSANRGRGLSRNPALLRLPPGLDCFSCADERVCSRRGGRAGPGASRSLGPPPSPSYSRVSPNIAIFHVCSQSDSSHGPGDPVRTTGQGSNASTPGGSADSSVRPLSTTRISPPFHILRSEPE